MHVSFNEKADRKQRAVVHLLSQHGVFTTKPHVQDVMQVLLARLTRTRFSLAPLWVHAGSFVFVFLGFETQATWLLADKSAGPVRERQ